MSNVVLLIFLLTCLIGCIGAQKKSLVPSVENCAAMNVDIDRYAREHGKSRLWVVLGFVGLHENKETAQAWLNARWKDIESQQREIDDCWRAVKTINRSKE